MRLASRMARLGTETAFSVLAKARALEAQGRNIIHLEIGEPDFDTPENIVEAGVRALRDGQTHYTPAAGIPQLREAIAADVAKSRGITVDPAQVVVTPGGKPIMFFIILALIDQGEDDEKHDRLATRCHHDLRRIDRDPARLRHVGGDRLAQLRDTRRRSVMRLPIPQGAHARLDDILRRVEIRFTDLQVNDIAALGLQRPRLRQDRERRLGAQTRHPARQSHR